MPTAFLGNCFGLSLIFHAFRHLLTLFVRLLIYFFETLEPKFNHALLPGLHLSGRLPAAALQPGDALFGAVERAARAVPGRARGQPQQRLPHHPEHRPAEGDQLPEGGAGQAAARLPQAQDK